MIQISAFLIIFVFSIHTLFLFAHVYCCTSTNIHHTTAYCSFPQISVRETLQFAADLRLPRSMPTSEKYNVVESLIMELGLKECADVLVGDAHGGEADQGGRHGISGGERRRVSAALQLLTNPSALLCDEVTSGKLHTASFRLLLLPSVY